MCAQFFVKFLPAFLGEEYSRVLQLNPSPGAWDVVCQPARPFHIEIHIICPQRDQRRFFQGLQLSINGKCVLIVELREEALEITYALLAFNQWTQILVDGVVANLLRVFIGRPQSWW